MSILTLLHLLFVLSTSRQTFVPVRLLHPLCETQNVFVPALLKFFSFNFLFSRSSSSVFLQTSSEWRLQAPPALKKSNLIYSNRQVFSARMHWLQNLIMLSEPISNFGCVLATSTFKQLSIISCGTQAETYNVQSSSERDIISGRNIQTPAPRLLPPFTAAPNSTIFLRYKADKALSSKVFLPSSILTIRPGITVDARQPAWTRKSAKFTA